MVFSNFIVVWYGFLVFILLELLYACLFFKLLFSVGVIVLLNLNQFWPLFFFFLAIISLHLFFLILFPIYLTPQNSVSSMLDYPVISHRPPKLWSFVYLCVCGFVLFFAFFFLGFSFSGFTYQEFTDFSPKVKFT